MLISSALFGTLIWTAVAAPAISETPTATAAITSTAIVADSTAVTPQPAGLLVNQAVAAAKAAKKTVLVHYGASWCGYCKKFDAFLANETIAPIINKYYVLLPLVAQEGPSKKALENPGVDSLSKAMGLKSGLPVFFFLDGEGKKIADSGVMPPKGDNIGHPVTSEEVTAFAELVKKSAPGMSAEELATLTGYLSKK